MGIKSSFIAGKFDPVADETARAIVTILAGSLGWQIRQTSGIAPGVYVAIAPGTGLDKWHRIDHVLGVGFEDAEILLPTDNGAALKVDNLYIIAASAAGSPGNPSFLLPNSATDTTLRIGQSITVLFSMDVSSAKDEIAEILPQGTDVILQADQNTGVDVQRDIVFIRIEYLGDPESIYGFNIWAITKRESWRANPRREGLIRRVDFMTVRPLPPYTASGIGLSLRLIGNTNGALTLDAGTTLNPGDTIAVSHEVNPNQGYHGIWSVEEVGDGSNPYVLIVDPRWVQGADVYTPFGSLIWVVGTGATGDRAQRVLMSMGSSATIYNAQDAHQLAPHNVKYAKYATTSPLTAFTPAGMPGTTDETLTANANGPLTIENGITPALDDLILIAAEIGANRQYHGVWNVEATGDGSNPFVLRRWWNWGTPQETREGAIVTITGTDPAAITPGRSYVWPHGSSPGDAADFFPSSSSLSLSLTDSKVANYTATVGELVRMDPGGSLALTLTSPLPATVSVGDLFGVKYEQGSDAKFHGTVTIAENGTGGFSLIEGRMSDGAEPAVANDVIIVWQAAEITAGPLVRWRPFWTNHSAGAANTSNILHASLLGGQSASSGVGPENLYPIPMTLSGRQYRIHAEVQVKHDIPSAANYAVFIIDAMVTNIGGTLTQAFFNKTLEQKGGTHAAFDMDLNLVGTLATLRGIGAVGVDASWTYNVEIWKDR